MNYQSATMAMVDHTLKSDKFNCLSKDYNKIRVIEPLVTSAVKNTTNDLKTSLDGIEFSVKTASSVEDKLFRSEAHSDEDHPFSPKDVLYRFKDVIRYTEICDHDDITQITKRTIDSMEKQGFVLSGVKNYFSHPYPDTGYKGMHLNFISPYGQEIELQVHSKSSFDAKQEGHTLYEQTRKVSTLKKDVKMLNEKMQQLYKDIKNPPGIDGIQDYRMPGWKRKKMLEEGRKNTSVIYENEYTKSGAEAICFAVYYKNNKTPILEGYENQYPDNSVKHYHINRSLQNEFAIITSVDDKGREIVSHDSAIRSKTLEEVKQAADITIIKHAELMEKLYPNVEKEEFADLINENQCKQQVLYMSGLDDFDFEEH